MTTLRGIPVTGDRPVLTAGGLARLRLVDREGYAVLMDAVHWPFPEAAGPALCGMPLQPGVSFAGLGSQGEVTCPDCLEWMRS